MSTLTTPLTVPIRRHDGGAPLVAPTNLWWENGVTFNAATTYLHPSEANRDIIGKLLAAAGKPAAMYQEGLVVIHYRARPRNDPGYLITRSFVGLALFTPGFELIWRSPETLVSPDVERTGPDHLGVEDPRITRVGDKFYMVYCGSGLETPDTWRGTLCVAESSDLLHWNKLGPVDLRVIPSTAALSFDDSYFDNLPGANGSHQHVNNKDGVLLEGPIDGWYYFLHRPMVGKISTWAMHLARSRSIRGPWTDLGPFAWAPPHQKYQDAWLGAGAVPIDLGGGRWLEIFHSGHRDEDGSRFYTLGAMVLNFNQLDPANPTSIVESRLDHFMVPETTWEIEGPYPDSVGNVLFTCGAFEVDDDICVVYGGGDTFVMAARVGKADLLAALVPVNHA